MNKINRQSLLTLLTIAHRLEDYFEFETAKIRAAAEKNPREAASFIPTWLAVLDDHSVPYRWTDDGLTFGTITTHTMRVKK